MVRDFLSRLFQPKADAYAVASGRQQTIDTRRLLTFDRRTYWAELNRWQKLTLFDSIYHTQELAQGAVNIITRFANSRMLPLVDNPSVARKMAEIWQEIDGHSVNAMIVRQSLIYGFACGEWVSEDLARMTRVVVPPSIEMRKLPDRLGQITGYIQLPGWTIARPATLDGRQTIPPEKIIDVVRDPANSFDYYGASLFESALDQFESLCQILDAQIRVYMRLGRPRFAVTINAEGLTPEQFQERIDKTQSVFANLGDLDATDLYMPAGTEVKIIGAESFGQRFSDETKLVISNILAAVGIPPALLHVTIQNSAGAESYARQSIIAMQTMIDEIQRSIAAAWNKSFWPMVQRIEGMPTTPMMGFEKPRLLEQTIEEQAREARRNNDIEEVVMGIRPMEWLAQRMGVSEIDDLEALKEYVAKLREMADKQSPLKNPSNEASSNTKITDQRATGNTSI